MNIQWQRRPTEKPFLLFLQRWLIHAVAVMVAANIVSGIHYAGLPDLLVAALLLGVLNAILRPLLLIISLPLVVLTLGLFTLVINALLLYFVGVVVKPFQVESFWAAFWGGLVISVVTLVLNTLTRTGETRVHLRPSGRVRDRHPPGQPPPAGPGAGPVIDV